jgi:putative SOS response-associated peptidase YedK
MCGRIALYTPPARLARLLDAAIAAGVETEAAPSWNVTPQRTLFGVADGGSGRVLDAYTWGLIAWWAKDASMSNRMFNARAETMASRPAYRDAFVRQRVLLPVDGFFEWDRRGGSREPHFFTRTDGEVLVLAGLYDRWRDPDGPPDAARRRTCTVVTTTPGPDLDGIHDRMPVVLERGAFDLWLTGADDELDAVQALCAPAARGTLVHHLVDTRVGNVRNDGPELIAAVAPPLRLFDQLGEQ